MSRGRGEGGKTTESSGGAHLHFHRPSCGGRTAPGKQGSRRSGLLGDGGELCKHRSTKDPPSLLPGGPGPPSPRKSHRWGIVAECVHRAGPRGQVTNLRLFAARGVGRASQGGGNRTCGASECPLLSGAQAGRGWLTRHQPGRATGGSLGTLKTRVTWGQACLKGQRWGGSLCPLIGGYV